MFERERSDTEDSGSHHYEPQISLGKLNHWEYKEPGGDRSRTFEVRVDASRDRREMLFIVGGIRNSIISRNRRNRYEKVAHGLVFRGEGIEKG